MGNLNICKITKSSFSLVNYCTLIRCEMRYYVYILNLLVWVPVKLSSTNFTFHHSANHKHSILTAFEYSDIYIAPILAVSLLKKIYALILQPKCRWLICLADFKVTREWHVRLPPFTWIWEALTCVHRIRQTVIYIIIDQPIYSDILYGAVSRLALHHQERRRLGS